MDDFGRFPRVLRRFALFAVAFSIVSITTGIFLNYSYGLTQMGPAAVWLWPVATVGQLLVVLVLAELAGHVPLGGANYQWAARLVDARFGYLVGALGVLYGAVGLPGIALLGLAPLTATVVGLDAADGCFDGRGGGVTRRVVRGNGGSGDRFRARAPWRNWAGNQRTDPARTVTARDAGDVVAAVKGAARDGLRLKAIGAGHSFTAIAVPDGAAVRAPSDPRLLHVDADGLATVPAGMTLRALNPLLWERGRALPNLGDIDAQTVAGALATGTHGTGAHHRGLADQVRALELVTADGAVRACSGSESADLFAAARVGLGALGVLVSVTLQTVPAFHLHAVDAAHPLAGALELFDGDCDHVEFYWFPHTDLAATKRNDRTDADGPVRGRVAEWVGDELIGNGAFALTCRLGVALPRLVPSLNRFAAGQFAHSECVDRSYRVFTSPRRVRFLEMEYAVPRAALPEAFAGLRRAVERHGRAVTFPVEVRVAAADDIPLSTASGRDSAYLAVHVHRGEPHEAYFGAVEAVMRDLDGRPHWGKLHSRAAADLRPAYPGFEAFVALRDRLDPERRFGNAYLERVLG